MNGINISVGTPKIRGGYLNINPSFPKDNSHVEGSPDALDEFVDTNECPEIIAIDVIERYPLAKLPGLLDYWITKLRHGGKLVIGGTDIVELSRLVANRTMKLDETNDALYKDGRQCILGIHDLIRMLLDRGLTILKRRVDSTRYIVEAQRP